MQLCPAGFNIRCMKQVCAVVLDRDGVINFDSPDYILTPEQWQPIPGSLEAIARLTKAGIAVAIASNQSALGRGTLDDATFEAIQTKMMQAITDAGGEIVHMAYCPHAPEDDCACRKPMPGMLYETLQTLGLSGRAGEVLFIGDSLRDVEAGVAAGMIPVLVQSGYGDAEAIHQKADSLHPGIAVYPDLAAAVNAILEP